MSRTGRLPSRARVMTGLRRSVAVLIAGVLTLTLTGSSGAVQPAAAVASPSPIAVVATPGAPSAAPASTAAPASPGPTMAPLPTPSPTPATATVGTPNIGRPLDPLPIARLQARLDSIRAKYKVPGVSITIVWPDGRSWTGVSGYADLGHRVKVVSGTAFSIGSVSKTFLATLILELVQEHKLSLSDTVLDWLPGAKVSPQITIRQLLGHTSGLYDFFENPNVDRALLKEPRRMWTPAEALSYMGKPWCAPGSCWAYSNSNYVLLGQIVERATGNTVATELRGRFFDPLDLGRTFVQGVEPRKGTVATAYKLIGTLPHRSAKSLADGTTVSPFMSVVTAAGSAGNIAASSADLARWARALYGGKVLSAQSLAQMLDTSTSRILHAPTPYGFALSTITLGGRLTWGHNGRLIGSRASIRYLPASGFTVAVVTNQDVIGPDVFGTSLLDIAFEALPPPVVPVPLLSIPPSAVPTPPGAAPSPAVGPSGAPVPTPTHGRPIYLYPSD
jgi:D-alanyl-D-alanine carboxypeptidase